MLNEWTFNGFLSGLFIFLVLGFVFHQSPTFAGSFAGHAIGIAGTFFMILALAYPFRKRVLKQRGKKNPLNRHITCGLVGPALVVIHSAHKFSSLIGLLTFLMLLLVVLSGIVGRYLYRRVNKTTRQRQRDLKLLKSRFSREKKERIFDCKMQGPNNDKTDADTNETDAEMERSCRQLMDEAGAIAEMEFSIQFFDRTKALFAKWLTAHYLLSLFLFALITVHVLSTLYYGLRWVR